MAETAQADLNVSFHADFEQAKRELKTMAVELKKVTSDVDLFEKFVGKIDTALSMASGGTNIADRAFQKLDTTLSELSGGIKNLNNYFAQLAAGGGKVYKSLKPMTNEMKKMVKANNDMAAQANRFNTGNITAQLQDIGVTAAMNMNPLTIGLQQGTQLVYVLQQSKAPLADFVAGIKSLFTPLSLVTVGLTALVAAGIQFVNWVDVGKGLLNGLASGFDYVGEHITSLINIITELGKVLLSTGVILSGVFAGLKMESILGSIASGMKDVWTGIKNIPNLMKDVWTGIKNIPNLMKDVWTGIKNIPNLMKDVWTEIKNISSATWTATINAGKMIKEFMAVKGVTVVFTGIGLAIAGATAAYILFGDTVKDVSNQIIGRIATVGNTIGRLPGLLGVGLGKGVLNLFSDKKTFGEGFTDEWNDILNENLKLLEKDYMGSLSETAKSVDESLGLTEKINAVVDKTRDAFNKAASGLRKYADGIGESTKNTKDLQKEIDKLAKSYDDIFTKQSDKYENMQFEESIKGLSTYEKTYLTVSRDMARDVENLKQQAIAAGIPMSKINEMFADSEGRIKAAAEAQAELTARIEESTMAEEEFNEFVRTAQSETSTFFKDMRHGLRDGQSAWEAFGNAVNNVLDKILDKLIDIGVEAAFSGLGSNTGGKGNSFLGTLFTAGKSLFGGISAGTQVYNSPIGPTMPGATPLTGAANGGVFSNGVYSSPTLFKFAKGGKFGVMGEAGPEAVMPLRRGPDGSLGVKADGVGGGSPVVVNVINNSNAQARTEQRQTSQGVEIDVMIDEMVAEKLGRNGTASNNALRAYNNRQLVMR